MYAVKVESDKTNVCFGCLSTDRQLTVLKDHVALFYNLLEDQQVYDTKIVLCWECRTLLHKIQAFQARIQQAQYLLQQSFSSLNTSCDKLSTLSSTIKDYFDYTLEYVDDETKEFEKQPETIELSVNVEKIVDTNDVIENLYGKSKKLEKSSKYNEKSKKTRKRLYINYEESENSNESDKKFNETVEESNKNLKNYEKSGLSNEIPNIDDDNPKKDYKNLNTEYDIPDIDIKQESDDECYSDFKVEDENYSTDEKDDENPDKKDKNYEQKEEKRTLSRKRYLENVNITDSDIDLDNLKKYCKRVTLNEEEIDEVLERELLDIRPGMRRNRPFKCKDCEKAYKREVDYKRHITFHHMDRSSLRVWCKFCRKRLPSWATLEKHWEKHNYHFRCTLCGLTMRPYSGLLNHIESFHSKIYTCIKCSKQLSNMREFKRHFKETHERIICDDCGKSFIKKRSLETHIRRHHLPPTCQICNRTYATYHNLENHYRLNHPELVRGINDKEELAYCVECNKQFPSVYKYRRHLTNAAIHTLPKIEVVPCPECGKVFSRKIRMTNHVLAVHRKTTKHRCDICNKTFCSAYSAKTHRQCVHEKIPMPKNKFCDICGRGFSTNRILANHRRTHTGERPYQCPHCPATFAQRTAMKTHAKTQHKNLMIDVTEH